MEDKCTVTQPDSDKPKTIRAKLRSAMADMGNPTKSKTATVQHRGGGQHSYKYTTLPEVLGVVRPALQSNGLDLMQRIGFTENGLTLRTSVFDNVDELSLDERPIVQSKDPQDFGSYETYMRRYALVTAFGLGVEDDDGKRAKEAAYQPKRVQPSDAERVEKGIKALMGVSVWTRDTLDPILTPLSDADKVKWLADAYKEAKAQMQEAQG